MNYENNAKKFFSVTFEFFCVSLIKTYFLNKGMLLRIVVKEKKTK